MNPVKIIGWFIAIVAMIIPHVFALALTFFIGSWFHMGAEKARVTFWVIDLVACTSAVVAFSYWYGKRSKRQQ
jgi:hypothetical protein